MTTTVRRPTPPTARRVAAERRRRMRLRRTVVVAVLLLVAGTVTARLLESPGTTTAETALADVRAAGSAAADRAAAPAAPGATVTPTSTPTPTPTSRGATATAAPSSPSATAAVRGDQDADAGPSPGARSATVPAAGDGVVTPVEIPAGPVAATGRPVRYSVEMEGGLPVQGADVARTVMAVLTDPRGWQTEDGVRFVPVSPAELATGARVDIRVTLASPTLTARLCAPLDVTQQQVSCWNGSRSVLNLTRWMLGSSTYGSDLAAYRIYLVSHEVGHGLGHGHVHCPAPGRPAPVMVQQTKTLEGCTAQPWPTGT